MICRNHNGNVMSVLDLPEPRPKRWHHTTKATVVAAVGGGIISLPDAYKRWELSVDEYLEWREKYRAAGAKGLLTRTRKTDQ